MDVREGRAGPCRTASRLRAPPSAPAPTISYTQSSVSVASRPPMSRLSSAIECASRARRRPGPRPGRPPAYQLPHVHDRAYSQAVAHLSEVRARNRRVLGVAARLTPAFTAVEVVGGLLTGSLALLADAAHMLSDNPRSRWPCRRLARRPPTPNEAGYQRAEVLAALANGVILVVLAIWIFVEAWGASTIRRTCWRVAGGRRRRRSCRQPGVRRDPPPRGTRHVNVRAALRHVLADTPARPACLARPS